MPNRVRQPFYPYLIATICFSMQAIGIGIYIGFGVFFNPLMAEFGWSRAAISGASSLAFFIMGIVGVLIGRLNDRFGPRPLLTVTALFLGLSGILMGRLTTLGQLYLFYGLLFGIGLSSIDVIALTTVARWFAHRRGLMTGIVKVGTGAGQFVVPLAASWLILHYGWRWSFVILGTVGGLVLVLMAQYLRRDPGALGLALSPSSDGAAADKMQVSSVGLSQALNTVQLWTICLVNLLLVFCLMIVLLHIVPHARDLGLAPMKAAGVLATIGAVSMLGRFLAGLGIDRWGSKPIMAGCFLLLLLGLAWLPVARQLWRLYLFAVVYGLAHGGFFTAISPLVAEWFGIGSHGALFGIVVGFGTAGGAVGPLLAGRLFDLSGSYTSTFWIIAVLSVISWALLLSLQPVKGD
jgi:MFS family permease